MKYVVDGNLRHNGQRFSTGDVVDMSPEDAQVLLEIGRLKPSEEAAAPAAPADSGVQTPPADPQTPPANVVPTSFTTPDARYETNLRGVPPEGADYFKNGEPISEADYRAAYEQSLIDAGNSPAAPNPPAGPEAPAAGAPFPGGDNQPQPPIGAVAGQPTPEQIAQTLAGVEGGAPQNQTPPANPGQGVSLQ